MLLIEPRAGLFQNAKIEERLTWVSTELMLNDPLDFKFVIHKGNCAMNGILTAAIGLDSATYS